MGTGTPVPTRSDDTHGSYVAGNDHVRRIVEEAPLQPDHVLQGLADHDGQPSVPPMAATRRPA